MNAYHIFYKSNKSKEFDEINYLVQLASILFWKKNQGKIILYCNSEFLEDMREWQLIDLYDEVNTSCLDNIPYKDYLNKYWSFCKIHASEEISKSEDNFVLLDTDFWIHNPIEISDEFEMIGYHPEQKLEDPKNPYISPENFMNRKEIELFDWSINPVNCAFLYLNSKTLINEWYKWVVKVIEKNKDGEIKEISADTIFLEQRLLPTIANSLNFKIGTLIPNTYQPHIPSDSEGSEWIPKIGFDEENQYITWNIKHVWGLKKMYAEPYIRNIVIDTVCDSLNKFFPEWEKTYTKIYLKMKELYS